MKCALDFLSSSFPALLFYTEAKTTLLVLVKLEQKGLDCWSIFTWSQATKPICQFPLGPDLSRPRKQSLALFFFLNIEIQMTKKASTKGYIGSFAERRGYFIIDW